MATRKNDDFYKMNEQIRPLVTVIKAAAQRFAPIERKLKKKVRLLEQIVNDPELKEFTTQEDEGISSLTSGPEGDDDYSNTFGLYYRINNEFLKFYWKILEGRPKDDGEGNLLFREELVHPPKVKKLDYFRKFFQSAEYKELSLAEKRDQALEELEALQDVTMNYAASVNWLRGSFPELYDLTYKVNTIIIEHFEGMKKAHTLKGQKIIHSPSLTSIASFLYDNLLGVSDIAEGVEVQNISKHQFNKNARLLTYLTSPSVYPFVKDATRNVQYAQKELAAVQEILQEIQIVTLDFRKNYEQIMHKVIYAESDSDKVPFIDREITALAEIDFTGITYQHPTKKPTQIQKADDERTNKSYSYIINSLQLLADKKTKRVRFQEAQKISRHILDLCEQFKREDEKSSTYFQCINVDEGAVGIEAIDPPSTSLESIRGKNYDRVKQHIDIIDKKYKMSAVAQTISARGRWKEHFMMIGPPGCGKSEVLRAIGSNSDSITIMVRGADLGTKWAFETEKNPRRLFELAENQHRKTGKHVYLALDEGEHILSKSSNHGNDARTHKQVVAEIQMILDGTRPFEGVTLVVALNNIKGIEEPMLRRYNAFVVGELNDHDRAYLLRDFASRGLPLSDEFNDNIFYQLGQRLRGATGDIVRTPIDLIEKKFIHEMYASPKGKRELEHLDAYLKDENGEFDIRNLIKDDRTYVKERFAAHGKIITPQLLRKAITKTMNEPNIMQLIDKAEEVYSEANYKVNNAGASSIEF